MRTRNILLASLAVFLYGCQPETPASKSTVSSESASPEAATASEEGMQLAKKNGCLACHALDKKLVGPSFRDIAAKYEGDAGAEARLAEVIAKGGRGVWGAASMPPIPQVSEANRSVLVKFVLSQR